MKYTDKQIRLLLKAIYEKTLSVKKLPRDLYAAISKYLTKALYEGFGGTITSFEFGTPDARLIAELRQNVYMFSGAKTYQQVREMGVWASKASTFQEFKNQALNTFEKYNVDWLRAEYNTAVGQAQIAKQWNDIEKYQDDFPYLRYSAVMDKNTSDICRPLDGIILPVGSLLWSKYAPLNHYNCRCILEQIDKYENPKLSNTALVKSIERKLDESVQPEFKMNPGKSGYIFSPKHSYFEVAPKDKALAKKNFNLPIPKKD